MKTFRIICLLACLTLIGFHIYRLNYTDLSFKANKTQYLGIVVMILVGFNFLKGIIKDRKKTE